MVRPTGHTVVELLVAAAVFSVLMTVTAILFTQTLAMYRRTSDTDKAMREMRRAQVALERDLLLASPSLIRRAQVPDSLGGGGRDGEALWFLSPIDTANGNMLRKQNGTAFWQRNILYYLVVPNNHTNTFGMTCVGGAGPNGYDDRCPHKLLIRKVIDSGPVTLPSNEATEETIINNISPYLTRPNGFSLTAMGGEPGLTQVKILGSYLLGFETFSAPAPNSIVTEIQVDMRALAILEAQRSARVGFDSFYASRYRKVAPFSVFLRN